MPIFVSEASGNGLWSIQMHNKPNSEFEAFFDLINDVEWLYHFFTHHIVDLNSGFFDDITPEAAVLRTLDEAEEMEDSLYNYSELGFDNNDTNLQHLFKPLNNFE